MQCNTDGIVVVYVPVVWCHQEVCCAIVASEMTAAALECRNAALCDQLERLTDLIRPPHISIGLWHPPQPFGQSTCLACADCKFDSLGYPPNCNHGQ